MLMMCQHIDAEQAFVLLVGVSQQHNVKVRDLAARIVADRHCCGPTRSAPAPRPEPATGATLMG